MAKKYNYDKKYLKGLGISPFLNQVKVRNKHINFASDSMPSWNYTANYLADALHPTVQHCKIVDIVERTNAKSFVLAPDVNKGTNNLAFFRAGQYISIEIEVGKIHVLRPYSISSSPKKAIDSTSHYVITIKNNENGFSSKEVNANWKIGQEVDVSGPIGEFYYQELRDAKNIVAVAGGSGITPFISMAEAIDDGTEDFNLTIIYGNSNKNSILFKKELDELAKKNSKKIKVIYVLEKEKLKGYESGLITTDIIKKYAPNGDFSLFVCGPKGLYKAVDKIGQDLKLPRRRLRKEVQGEYGDPSKDKLFPKELVNKTFKLIVHHRDERFEITCSSNQTILNALEKGGVLLPSRCRSGECGVCHSLLIKGNVYVPKSNDGRRLADLTFNWIHPCCTYPLSDIEMEIPSRKRY